MISQPAQGCLESEPEFRYDSCHNNNPAKTQQHSTLSASCRYIDSGVLKIPPYLKDTAEKATETESNNVCVGVSVCRGV